MKQVYQRTAIFFVFVHVLCAGGAVHAASLSGQSTKNDPSFYRIEASTDPDSIYPSLSALPAKLELSEAAVERMKVKYEDLVRTSRYMEHGCVAAADYANWEGFPLARCRYEVKDADGTAKNASVIMLNPSPDQLARWTVACCLIVKGSADSAYTDRLYAHIRGQSGAQFPVTGIVYEDMEGDGKHKIYCFRDGVTAKIKGIPHTGTAPLTEEEINTSLYGAMDSSWTGQFARIQSTTREQYRAIGGPVDVGDKDHRKIVWLDVVRELYKAAWKSDVNILLIAWAYANLK